MTSIVYPENTLEKLGLIINNVAYQRGELVNLIKLQYFIFHFYERKVKSFRPSGIWMGTQRGAGVTLRV